MEHYEPRWVPNRSSFPMPFWLAVLARTLSPLLPLPHLDTSASWTTKRTSFKCWTNQTNAPFDITSLSLLFFLSFHKIKCYQMFRWSTLAHCPLPLPSIFLADSRCFLHSTPSNSRVFAWVLCVHHLAPRQNICRWMGCERRMYSSARRTEEKLLSATKIIAIFLIYRQTNTGILAKFSMKFWSGFSTMSLTGEKFMKRNEFVLSRCFSPSQLSHLFSLSTVERYWWFDALSATSCLLASWPTPHKRTPLRGI